MRFFVIFEDVFLLKLWCLSEEIALFVSVSLLSDFSAEDTVSVPRDIPSERRALNNSFVVCSDAAGFSQTRAIIPGNNKSENEIEICMPYI